MTAMRKEVARLHGQRRDLLDQVEFLTRLVNESALPSAPRCSDYEVELEYSADTIVDPPPSLLRFQRRRTKSEGAIVCGEFVAA